MTWTIIFMLVILKIPILYVGAVIYYAIKAEPPPPYGTDTPEPETLPSPFKPWQSFRYNRSRSRPSHGGPSRRAARTGRAAATRTRAK